METVIQGIKRPIYLDDKEITAEELLNNITQGEVFKIVLKPVHQAAQPVTPEPVEQETEELEYMEMGKTYLFKVRQYMTKPASPEFDFQSKFNNDVPMPFRTMVGTVLKETRGMVYMDCHVEPMETTSCMRCGRRLNHPVSKLYGIGPECGSHAYLNPFQTEEELYAALDSVKSNLANITWQGWVIKSAIEEHTEVVTNGE